MSIRYITTETVTDLENNKSNAFSPFTVNIVNAYKNNNAYASCTNSVHHKTAAHLGVIGAQFNIEANTLTNLQAGFKFNHHWDVRLMVHNIFDQIGYNAYRTSHINQTDPRSFAGILRYTL